MAKTQLHNTPSIHYIKYMGSKSKIIPFILEGLDKIYQGGVICDLFSGSCSLAGSIGSQVNFFSNDIQSYSGVIAKAFLTDWNDKSITVKDIISKAEEYHSKHFSELATQFMYETNMNIELFREYENQSKKFINTEFSNEWHLFTKYYSGTWWSLEQATWIDSFRAAIESYKEAPMYNTMLCCLMYAMAYCSQGTGHYAQYRDANTESSKDDILIYRMKSISYYFERKFEESLNKLPLKRTKLNHSVTTLDYEDCLSMVKNSTVYADPPYCFVHYSRFYHALETIILYDYPKLQFKGNSLVKGRYREDRHQSPFSIRSKVENAFRILFNNIVSNNNNLALSYSNKGLISLERLIQLSNEANNGSYNIEIMEMKHDHMTMGRKEKRKNEVSEVLLLMYIKRKV